MLDVARVVGAECAVIEPGYVDPDYRSEYLAFYARAFAPYPAVATRVHFFAERLDAARLWRLPTDIQERYLGYAVLRPNEFGRVGRAVLRAPVDMAPFIRTAISEPVHLYGHDLSVQGVPFVEQDTQLGRCAHAAAWLCHYTAFRRGEVGRQLMGAFSIAANPALSDGRQLPSSGLNVRQILEVLRLFGLSTIPYFRSSLPPPILKFNGGKGTAEDKNATLIELACRYLNSGLPVLVGTANHAFVLVGYGRRPGEGAERIAFIRQDDQRGPYLWLEPDATGEEADLGVRGWQSLVVPLPGKVWLAGEDAEGFGARFLLEIGRRWAQESPTAAQFMADEASGDITFRTCVVESNAFKRSCIDRIPDDVVAAYRMLRMSKFIWVVEAIDRRLRDRPDEACVVGEVLLDATSNGRQPKILAWHLLELAAVTAADGTERRIQSSGAPYRSGGVGPS